MNRRKPQITVDEVAILDTRKFSTRLREFFSHGIVHESNGWYVLDIDTGMFPIPRFSPTDAITAEVLELLWIRSRRRKLLLPEPLGRPKSRNKAKGKGVKRKF